MDQGSRAIKKRILRIIIQSYLEISYKLNIITNKKTYSVFLKLALERIFTIRRLKNNLR